MFSPVKYKNLCSLGYWLAGSWLSLVLTAYLRPFFWVARHFSPHVTCSAADLSQLLAILVRHPMPFHPGCMESSGYIILSPKGVYCTKIRVTPWQGLRREHTDLFTSCLEKPKKQMKSGILSDFEEWVKTAKTVLKKILRLNSSHFQTLLEDNSDPN